LDFLDSTGERRLLQFFDLAPLVQSHVMSPPNDTFSVVRISHETA